MVASPNSVQLEKTDTSSTFPKSVTVTTSKNQITASADQTWCKTKVEGKTVKIGAQANSGAQRTANVTISDGDQSVKVTVTQATGTV